MKASWVELRRHPPPATPSPHMQVTLRVRIARGFLARARGLLGRRMPAPGCGLLLQGVAVVHSFGMCCSLDLVFLDEQGFLVGCVRLAPFGVARFGGARHVLEMRAGEAARLGLLPGMRPHLVLIDDIFGSRTSRSEDLAGAKRRFCRRSLALLAVLALAVTLAANACWAAPPPAPASAAVAAEGRMAASGRTTVASPSSQRKRFAPAPAVASRDLQRLEDEAEALYREDVRDSDAALIGVYESLAELAEDRSPRAWLRIGNIHQRSGAVGDAIDAYRQAAVGAAEQPGTAQSTQRKALLNLTAMALDQATQSLARLASMPPDAAGRGTPPGSSPPDAQRDLEASLADAAHRRQLETLTRQFARQREPEPGPPAQDLSVSIPQAPLVLERYTASGRRNAVKSARGSLHLHPADGMPAGPIAAPRSRASPEQLPSVEYLHGDPHRSTTGTADPNAAREGPGTGKGKGKGTGTGAGAGASTGAGAGTGAGTGAGHGADAGRSAGLKRAAGTVPGKREASPGGAGAERRGKEPP